MNAPPMEALLRMPPHSTEAEQALIGGLMLDNNALDRVADVVVESDFYRDDHRRIYRHIARLIMQGKGADVITVFESIERSNEVDQTGGLAYLAEIANCTPSAANARRYAEIVADRATRRALLMVSGQIAADAEGAGDSSAAERVDQALGRLMALSEARAGQGEPEFIQASLGEAIQELEMMVASDGKLPGLSTPWPPFDNMPVGLRPGHMIIVAGRPSMGKTAFVMNIAEHTVLAGGVALMFSMEMTKVELSQRLLSSVSGIPLTRLLNGKLTDDDWDRVTAALGKLHEVPFVVDETGGLTLAQIRARARRIMRRQGRLDLVVIDYMQLMEAGRDGENRNAELTAISRGIKAMAKELRCPVIALSQLSRKVEERANKRPMMSDLRESGALEQDADSIILLYRDEYYKPETMDKGIAEIIIAKQRSGPTGEVKLHFDGECCRFRNLSASDVVRLSGRSDSKARGRGFNGGDE